MSREAKLNDAISAAYTKVCPDPTPDDCAAVVVALIQNAVFIAATTKGHREYDPDLIKSAVEAAVKAMFAEIKNWPSRN